MLMIFFTAVLWFEILQPVSFLYPTLIPSVWLLHQAVSPPGALPLTTWWTARTTQPMRSWSGSSAPPLRAPASVRSLGRGGALASTGNHVSGCWIPPPALMQIVPRVTNSFLPVRHSEEDAEERLDDRGGQRSWPVQWFRDAGVKRTGRHPEAPSVPHMISVCTLACCDELSSSCLVHMGLPGDSGVY